MYHRSFKAFVAVSVAVLTSNAALAQLDFTIRVDKSGNLDQTTIQGAIDSITNPAAKRWTVLIYSGEYAENVVLKNNDQNIDLVGVDPDGVIIAPTSGIGLEIKSGEAVSRNHLIKNLTIKTTNDHGIYIHKNTTGDEPPKDIIIEGVTIEAAGTGKDGINASEVNNLTIRSTSISAADGHGLILVLPLNGDVPTNITLESVNINADGGSKAAIKGPDATNLSMLNCVLESADSDSVVVGTDFSIDTCTIYAPSSTATALTMTSESGLEITNSLIGIENSAGSKPKRAILIDSSSDVEIVSCLIQSQEETIRLDQPGDDVRFRSCFISAEGEGSSVVGIYGEADDSSTETPPVFHCCDIEVKAGASTEIACCVEIDKTEGIEFVHCYIRAFSRNEQADVLGIAAPTAHVNIIQCAFNELAKRSTGNVNIARN